jgi:(S)-2-hydroxy-acid oxidase
MAGNSNIACLQDIEEIAMKTLPRNALDFYRSGANQMTTLKDNRNAFQRYIGSNHVVVQ